jgi:hypothetical protein
LNTRQAAKENTILSVKLNAGGIALVSHSVFHGVTDSTFCHHVEVFSSRLGSAAEAASLFVQYRFQLSVFRYQDTIIEEFRNLGI